MKNKITAVILAGGRGERMQAELPKQFLFLAGQEIITRTLKCFEKSPIVSEIIIVCFEDYIDKTKALIDENNIRKVSKVIPGGKTRQESSFLGVKSCSSDTEIVLIHDAVRPFVSEKIIKDVSEGAAVTGAAAPVIDMTDTVVSKKDDLVGSIPDRTGLKRIQTPQAFRYDMIRKAHQMAKDKGTTDATDDCTLVLNMPGSVKAVGGSAYNLKITDGIDLETAEALLASGKADL
ncbi:MAG: 2-C-methyl-D-erythritol 4-phosphate cytidylyltransferase [Candidatus Omnitrophica bacterium]|nr:2-C-methyl-D-erythritol 4-phosphate cytidylyltransferase [Candidatus Omnitrophota bacterium]